MIARMNGFALIMMCNGYIQCRLTAEWDMNCGWVHEFKASKVFSFSKGLQMGEEGMHHVYCMIMTVSLAKKLILPASGLKKWQDKFLSKWSWQEENLHHFIHKTSILPPPSSSLRRHLDQVKIQLTFFIASIVFLLGVIVPPMAIIIIGGLTESLLISISPAELPEPPQ